jgi:hypothetical protein
LIAIAGSLGITADTAPAWLVALLFVQVFVLAMVFAAWANLRRLRRKWDVLLLDAGDRGLPDLLEEYLLGAQRQEDRLIRLEMRVGELEDRLRASLRRFGMVKYDAFDEVGGEQSFALALLDDLSNGVVVTSLVGRAESRVFAKELHDGKATVVLTKEEETAIGIAHQRA